MYTKEQHDSAAQIINDAFENDDDFAGQDMSAQGRLLLTNVEAGFGSTGESDFSDDSAPAPTALTNRAKKSKLITAKNVEVYPETATVQEMIDGPTERLRGLNVLRLAKTYGNQQLADAINEAHPDEKVTGNGINERMKAAYAALDDGGSMRKEVEEARASLGIRVGATGKKP